MEMSNARKGKSCAAWKCRGVAVALAATMCVQAQVAVTVDGARADLAFDAVPYARDICLAWGAADAGRRTNGWDNVAVCGMAAPDATAAVGVFLPAGYDPASHRARFVLIDRYDSASYVADGLVAQWDGIDNAGRGQHDAAATVWKDLAGSHDIAHDDLSFTDTCGHFPYGKRATVPFSLPAASDKTVETVVRTDSTLQLSAGLNGRVDIVSVGMDGAICYRGDGWNVHAIFVDPASRTAYYVGNPQSPLDAAALVQQDRTYSAVFRQDVSDSDMRINNTLFVRGIKDGRLHTTSSGFAHTEKTMIGLHRGPSWFSSIRIYSRALTAGERRHNERVDAVRFRGAEPPQSASHLLGAAPALAAFRVGHWNIGHFSLGLNGTSTIAPADAEAKAAAYNAFLDAMAADWMGFCEYSAEFTSDGSVKTRDALLSRYAVESIGPSKGFNLNAAFATPRFEIVETVTNFFLRHDQDRYYLAHRVAIDDAQEAWLVQAHLDFSDESFRAEQIRELIDDFADYPRVVIAGDFNTILHNADGTTQTKWDDAALFTAAGYTPAETTQRGRSAFVIDNVFARGFAVEDVSIHPHQSLSDHRATSCTLRPLAAGEVQLPPPPPPLHYTGQARAPAIAANSAYTVTVEGEASAVGDYPVTVALADPSATRWTDGSTTNLHYTLTVTKARNGWTTPPAFDTPRWTRGEAPGVIDPGVTVCGTPAAGMTPEQLAAAGEGTWTVNLSVPGTSDYFGCSTTLTFRVVEPFLYTLHTNGTPVVDLTFGTWPEARTLYVAWGGTDGGEDIDAWEHVREAATVPANATSVSGVALPEGVGTSYGSVRFFIRAYCDTFDYVRDGLVGLWDAKDNAGPYLHDGGATVWTNLVGGASFPMPAAGWTFNEDHLFLGKGVRATLALDTLKNFTARTAEIVCHTDEDFDFTSKSRSAILNVGNDGIVSYRGANNYFIHAIFVNSEDRCAYYMANLDSPYNTIAHATSFNSFSINAYPDAAQSSLYVNDSLFAQGTTTGRFHIDKTSYKHNSNLQIGLDRGKAYISSVRLYDRVLTAAERRRNLGVDQDRYLGGRGHLAATGLIKVPVPFSVERIRTGAAVTGATLRFTAADGDRAIYFAHGARDAGASMDDWSEAVRIGTVPAGASVATVALPEGVATGGFRFFLVPDPGAAAYVQGGLVAQWDAVENAGAGLHVAETDVWKDLAGAYDIDMSACGHSFADGLLLLPKGSSPTVSLAELANCTNKTVEVVCRTDEGFNTTLSGRMDIVNAGNDCAICYRGGDGYMILGIYVNPANRTGYYTRNTASPHNTAARIRALASYSLAYDAGDYSKNSSLRVNDDLFTSGVTGNKNTGNWYYSTTFNRNQNLRIALNSRANQYIASLRVYGRVLTAAERTANYQVDKARFLAPAPRDVSPYTVVLTATTLFVR